MERVTGIGGVFFKSQDPERLRRWYAENLGVQLEEYGGAAFSWGGPDSEEGVTAWSIFDEKSDHFGKSGQRHMINYRVKNLDAMLAQLRAAGASVDEQTMDESFGKFGWAYDCDGNKLELWEPK